MARLLYIVNDQTCMFQHRTLRTWIQKYLVYAFDVDQTGYLTIMMYTWGEKILMQ